MKQLQAVAAQPPGSASSTPQNVELRHLRYFVAVAEAGTFTEAAQRMFIAQPTLSQQLRRPEDIVGTRLLHRRRDGLRLTTAGAVLLEASRAILSLVDHGVSHTRQAAGLGRHRLRVAVPPHLPDALAARTASRLMPAAAAVGVDVTWAETPLDGDFSLIRQRKADAGLGWLAGAGGGRFRDRRDWRGGWSRAAGCGRAGGHPGPHHFGRTAPPAAPAHRCPPLVARLPARRGP